MNLPLLAERVQTESTARQSQCLIGIQYRLLLLIVDGLFLLFFSALSLSLSLSLSAPAPSNFLFYISVSHVTDKVVSHFVRQSGLLPRETWPSANAR